MPTPREQPEGVVWRTRPAPTGLNLLRDNLPEAVSGRAPFHPSRHTGIEQIKRTGPTDTWPGWETHRPLTRCGSTGSRTRAERHLGPISQAANQLQQRRRSTDPTPTTCRRIRPGVLTLRPFPTTRPKSPARRLAGSAPSWHCLPQGRDASPVTILTEPSTGTPSTQQKRPR